ncbi:MAG TPA: polysaccharide deacetylase family protein, partial [Vicinamibacterales bacterium]
SLPMESDETIIGELQESKWALEQHLGGPVTHFAYPGGQFTPPVVEAVARAGYQFAYTACTHDEPKHPALTIERLLLWEGSSADANGRFSPAILNCQAHDLWPPARRCERSHTARATGLSAASPSGAHASRGAGTLPGHPTAPFDSRSGRPEPSRGAQACAAGTPPPPAAPSKIRAAS